MARLRLVTFNENDYKGQFELNQIYLIAKLNLKKEYATDGRS